MAALPPNGDPAPLLDAAGQRDLEACWEAAPDATLNETRLLLAAAGGPAVSRTTTWRATEAAGHGSGGLGP